MGESSASNGSMSAPDIMAALAERVDGRMGKLEELLEHVEKDLADVVKRLDRITPATDEFTLTRPWGKLHVGILLAFFGLLTYLAVDMRLRVIALERFAAAGDRVTTADIEPLFHCMEQRFQDRVIGLESGGALAPPAPVLILEAKKCLERLAAQRRSMAVRGAIR